jgi:hypothetical protein
MTIGHSPSYFHALAYDLQNLLELQLITISGFCLSWHDIMREKNMAFPASNLKLCVSVCEGARVE